MSDLIKRDEAIRMLGDANFENYGYAIMVIQDVPTVAKDERLIPKSPIFQKGESIAFVDYSDRTGDTRITKWAEWCCPSCGWFVGEQYVPRRHNQRKSNYCSRCGQAIDWNAVEPEKFALLKRSEKERKELEEMRKKIFTEVMK